MARPSVNPFHDHLLHHFIYSIASQPSPALGDAFKGEKKKILFFFPP
jgi:hypothetical protein